MSKIRNIAEIVEALFIIGSNFKMKSMFISGENSSNIVNNYLHRNNISFEWFLTVENVLRFSNMYNLLKSLLNISDKSLQENILINLRNTELFCSAYLNENIEHINVIKKMVSNLYVFFIDSVHDEAMVNPMEYCEDTTNKFMFILSSSGKDVYSGDINNTYIIKQYSYKDMKEYMIFYIPIMNDIMSLPKTLKYGLKVLELK